MHATISHYLNGQLLTSANLRTVYAPRLLNRTAQQLREQHHVIFRVTRLVGGVELHTLSDHGRNVYVIGNFPRAD